MDYDIYSCFNKNFIILPYRKISNEVLLRSSLPRNGPEEGNIVEQYKHLCVASTGDAIYCRGTETLRPPPKALVLSPTSAQSQISYYINETSVQRICN